MLDDARKMLEAQRKLPPSQRHAIVVDEKTGATALHVAAAKGYTDVIHLLLKEHHDVHVTDLDGWTPLHAAAHWDQKDACTMLVKEGLADLEKLTHSVRANPIISDQSCRCARSYSVPS